MFYYFQFNTRYNIEYRVKRSLIYFYLLCKYPLPYYISQQNYSYSYISSLEVRRGDIGDTICKSQAIGCLLVDPTVLSLFVLNNLLRLEPQCNLLLGGFHRVGAVADVTAHVLCIN